MRSIRPCVAPNIGFLHCLRVFQEQVLHNERRHWRARELSVMVKNIPFPYSAHDSDKAVGLVDDDEQKGGGKEHTAVVMGENMSEQHEKQMESVLRPPSARSSTGTRGVCERPLPGGTIMNRLGPLPGTGEDGEMEDGRRGIPPQHQQEQQQQEVVVKDRKKGSVDREREECRDIEDILYRFFHQHVGMVREVAIHRRRPRPSGMLPPLLPPSSSSSSVAPTPPKEGAQQACSLGENEGEREMPETRRTRMPLNNGETEEEDRGLHNNRMGEHWGAKGKNDKGGESIKEGVGETQRTQVSRPRWGKQQQPEQGEREREGMGEEEEEDIGYKRREMSADGSLLDLAPAPASTYASPVGTAETMMMMMMENNNTKGEWRKKEMIVSNTCEVQETSEKFPSFPSASSSFRSCTARPTASPATSAAACLASPGVSVPTTLPASEEREEGPRRGEGGGWRCGDGNEVESGHLLHHSSTAALMHDPQHDHLQHPYTECKDKVVKDSRTLGSKKAHCKPLLLPSSPIPTECSHPSSPVPASASPTVPGALLCVVHFVCRENVRAAEDLALSNPALLQEAFCPRRTDDRDKQEFYSPSHHHPSEDVSTSSRGRGNTNRLPHKPITVKATVKVHRAQQKNVSKRKKEVREEVTSPE